MLCTIGVLQVKNNGKLHERIQELEAQIREMRKLQSAEVSLVPQSLLQ